MHTNIRYIVFIFLTLLVVNGTLKAQIRSETDSIVAPTLSANINEIEADTTVTDSLNLKKEFLDNNIKHRAKDYVQNDFINERVILYNEAELLYGDIELRAGEIIIDYKTNLAYAKGIIDTAGAYVQRPKFKQGAQESEQDSLIYNFKSEKALIYNH